MLRGFVTAQKFALNELTNFCPVTKQLKRVILDMPFSAWFHRPIHSLEGQMSSQLFIAHFGSFSVGSTGKHIRLPGCVPGSSVPRLSHGRLLSGTESRWLPRGHNSERGLGLRGMLPGLCYIHGRGWEAYFTSTMWLSRMLLLKMALFCMLFKGHLFEIVISHVFRHFVR